MLRAEINERLNNIDAAIQTFLR
jgi:hypothetical protein